MGFSLTSPAPEKCDPTAKNRVWGFFGEAQESRLENHPQTQQPRRENPPTTTKLASGRTYWPSRDPIGERDFKNEAVEYSEILSQSSSLSQLAETELSNLASLSGLSPIHYRSVKKELEKSGRKASRNLYGFVQNDSVSSYDLFGLLKVCSSHAFGSPLANHAYLNGSDDGATSCGQNGSSGKGDPTGDGAPNNPGDPCNEVALPPGKSPREAASCICNCMKRKGETSLPWLPGANDCHKQLKDCFKECGIAYPGAPGGRLNPPKPSGKKRCRCFHPSRR